MKYVSFHKSPIGFHVFVEGRKHPVGYIKRIDDKYCIIHNKLTRNERQDYHNLIDAKKKITELINR